MECYLDNASTTRVDDEVASLIQELMLKDYGNPASLHSKGFEAEQHIRSARSFFCDVLKCRESEIVFTSGGTESDNLAIIGTYFVKRRRGNHIITTKIEHPAVSQTIQYLAEVGAKVDLLDVDRHGHIDLAQLDDLLSDKTSLVSVMHVNNEVGAVEPIAEIGRLIRKKHPDCLFHVDDVQGFGKIPIIPAECKVDLLSVSSHKLHGPKGAGLLYKSDRTKITELMHGGGQQNGLRSGTENVPGVAGFALAASKLYGSISEDHERMKARREKFLLDLQDIEDIRVNGGDAPDIISLSIKDIRAEVMVHALAEKGIFVSAGSACASKKPQISPTLSAMDVEKWQLESTIRISLSAHTTQEEMDYAAEQIKLIVPDLRRFVRR